MNEIEKKISNLRYTLSMLNFASEMDFDKCRKIEKEIENLEPQRYGWCVELKNKYSTEYLTNDPILCLSSEPTYFETMKEAYEYLDKAEIDTKEWKVRLIERVKQ